MDQPFLIFFREYKGIFQLKDGAIKIRIFSAKLRKSLKAHFTHANFPINLRGIIGTPEELFEIIKATDVKKMGIFNEYQLYVIIPFQGGCGQKIIAVPLQQHQFSRQQLLEDKLIETNFEFCNFMKGSRPAHEIIDHDEIRQIVKQKQELDSLKTELKTVADKQRQTENLLSMKINELEMVKRQNQQLIRQNRQLHLAIRQQQQDQYQRLRRRQYRSAQKVSEKRDNIQNSIKALQKLQVLPYPPQGLIKSEEQSLETSKVLTKKQNLNEIISFIFQALNSPKDVRLIFRASQHQYRASSFHKYCNDIEDTLVVVRTDFGKTIAGYTHYKWNHAIGAVYDEEMRAFLLQLDLMQKMVPIDSQIKLIDCCELYGPIFGQGCDLFIGDYCDYGNSYANFPTSYNLKGPQQYKRCQQSFTAFSGAINGDNFRVVEYEVYRVIY